MFRVVTLLRPLCKATVLWACMAATAAPGDTGAARPQMLLMPADAVADEHFADGCWVRLYDGVNFQGLSLMLAGALELTDMSATLQPWRDWDSASIGPRARLQTFKVKGFRAPAATLVARQRVPDLTGSTGRFDDIESLRLQCLRQ